MLTHVLYVDDIIIFCTDTKRNIRELLNIFHKYSEVSGQIVNNAKSRFFTGKPKVDHYQMITDSLKAKLSTWKGSVLSVMGRVQLVKSIIHGMLVYFFHVYMWPWRLFRLLDT